MGKVNDSEKPLHSSARSIPINHSTRCALEHIPGSFSADGHMA